VRKIALVVLVVGLVGVFAPPASAATKTVDIPNFGFNPATVKVKLGDTVMWTNSHTFTHTSTGDTPLAYWDTMSIAPGTDKSITFTGGGTFTYHCFFHPSMLGTVQVQIKAKLGGTGKISVNLGSVDATGDFRYAPEVKRPGAPDFVPLATTTNKTIKFTPDAGPGVYQFRTRVNRISNNSFSGYSTAQVNVP
jgi:plastocyanin